MVDLNQEVPSKNIEDRTDARFDRLLQEIRETHPFFQYTGPVTGFQTPGIPIEIPLAIPIAAAPAKATIPKVIKSGKFAGIDGLRALRGHLLRRAELAQAAKVAKYGKYAKSLGPLLAFQVGWEIGDMLFPNGWYDFATGSPASDAGPWSHPKFCYYACPSGTPDGGHKGFRTTGMGGTTVGDGTTCTGVIGGSNGTSACNPATAGILQTTHYATPKAALDAHLALFPGQLDHISAIGKDTTQFNQEAYGTYWLKFSPSTYDDTAWTNLSPASPGQPKPLVKARPSEAPETFPLEWPMEMPWAQPWKDAVPKPKTQGEAKHLTRSRATGLVPQMPLPPFPVTVVPIPDLPPGGTVPPPPEVVITIPPNGPPTVHTQPPQGRRPPQSGPKGKVKEPPKLSVRSKANRAWIIVNAATEAFDFVDAAHEGLPAECKAPPGSDPYQKAVALWNCSDRFDWSKFINAWINQQVTDMAVGFLGMAAQQSLKVSGAATGSGWLSRNANAREYASDQAIKKKLEAGEITQAEAVELDKSDDLPIPTMTFNEASGHWEVSIQQWGLTFK